MISFFQFYRLSAPPRYVLGRDMFHWKPLVPILPILIYGKEKEISTCNMDGAERKHLIDSNGKDEGSTKSKKEEVSQNSLIEAEE